MKTHYAGHKGTGITIGTRQCQGSSDAVTRATRQILQILRDLCFHISATVPRVKYTEALKPNGAPEPCKPDIFLHMNTNFFAHGRQHVDNLFWCSYFHWKLPFFLGGGGGGAFSLTIFCGISTRCTQVAFHTPICRHIPNPICTQIPTSTAPTLLADPKLILLNIP